MRLLVLRVMLQQIISHILDWILGLDLLLRECGECLQDQRHDCLIEVRADGDGLERVFSGLNREGITWLMECNLILRIQIDYIYHGAREGGGQAAS